MKGKKKLLIGLGIVVVLAVFIGANVLLKPGADEIVQMPESDLAVEVKTIESKIYVNGSVVTDEARKINYDGTGVVEEVYVELGEKVKDGQLLAKINSDELEHQLKSARIQLEMEEERLAEMERQGNTNAISAYKNAQISYNDAVVSYDSTKSLYDQGAVSKAEMDAATSRKEQAKINLDNQRAMLEQSESGSSIALQQKSVELQRLNLDRLEKELEKTNVRSTIDGTVTDINVQSGEAFERALHMFYIENFDKNVIKANISESEINSVAVGQKVEVTGRSIRGEKLTGTVTEIEPGTTRPQGANQAYVQVTIKLDEPEERLRPDFAVNLVIETDKRENTLAVPFEAVLNDKDGNMYVLVQQEDGTTKRVDVKVGLEGDLYVEVLSDQLSEGDPLSLTENVPATPPAE